MAYGNGSGYESGTLGKSGQAPIGTTTPQALGQRVSLIDQQVHRLDNGTEVLHKTISDLEARLISVLVPEPPNAPDKSSGAPIIPVALGQAIGTQADRVHSACARLGALIARIEL